MYGKFGEKIIQRQGVITNHKIATGMSNCMLY